MNWKQEYLKNLNDVNVTYSELGTKIEKYRPTKLYRYMRFDEFWEKNIFEGQVYLSSASFLNDPFDCLVYVDKKKYTEYIFQKAKFIFPDVNRQLLRKETQNSVDEIVSDYFEEAKKRIRVACFTEDYASPLMWAHYADSHKGFCIEYDLNRITDGFRNAILPMIYSNERYDATEAVTTKNSNISINSFYFKSLHWKYEKEWRMMATENMFTDGEYFADFSKAVSGIYLGLKSKAFHEEKISKILRYGTENAIPVYEMYLNSKTYDLNKKVL